MWYNLIEIFLNVILLAACGLTLARDKSKSCGEFNRDATVPLRAILAFCVITTHVPPWQSLDLGTVAVSIFFFMSGYGMMKADNASRLGVPYVHGLVLKHAKKLFCPYLFCSIPWLLRMLVFRQGSDGRTYCLKYFWDGVCNGDFNVFLPNSWFPWVLFLFAVIFSCSFRVCKRCRVPFLLTLLAMYYFIVRYGCKWGTWWWITTWAYPVGVLFAKGEGWVVSMLDRWGWRLPIVLLLVYVLAQLGSIYLYPCVPIVSELPHAMTGISVALILFYHPLPRVRWLIFLGGISYEIYLVHGVVWAFAARVIDSVPLAVAATYLLTPILAFAVNRMSALFRSKVHL